MLVRTGGSNERLALGFGQIFAVALGGEQNASHLFTFA